jgi:hypothetical protein
VTEKKPSELEGITSESEARKKPKTSVTEGKLFTDVMKQTKLNRLWMQNTARDRASMTTALSAHATIVTSTRLSRELL